MYGFRLSVTRCSLNLYLYPGYSHVRGHGRLTIAQKYRYDSNILAVNL